MNSYLQVILGLGFVIFVHELGHFLLAKWNGVKVEKFSIGFGMPLVAWRRGIGLKFLGSTPPPPNPPLVGSSGETTPAPGPVVGETEYALAAIPLGGFVKMLGESTEDENRSTDPRAYPNKSVGARMAIISAGVIMNVIFGLICFALVYRNGLKEIPPLVGSVTPGSPAYLAGLRPGDEILAINSKKPVTFHDLRIRSALSGQGESLRLEMSRPGVEQPFVVQAEPRGEPGSPMPRVGLAASHDVFLGKVPFQAPPGMTNAPTDMPLKAGDRIVALGPADGDATPVATPHELDRLLTRFRGIPIQVEARGGGTDPAPSSSSESENRRVVLPVTYVLDFGLRMELGPIDAVRKDSPAEQAGFRAGDQIVKVDGREDLDPMRLPFEVYDRAGKEVEIVVRRSLAGSSKGQLVTLKVVPEAEATWVNQPLVPYAPVDVPALGLAYRINPKVVAVAPGSSAAEAGITPGTVVKSANVIIPRTEKDKPTGKTDTEKLAFDGPEAVSWAYLFGVVQLQPGLRIELLFGEAAKPVELEARPVPDWFDPYRGLNFKEMERDLPPQGTWAAMGRGVEEAVDNALQVFFMIRGLVQGRLSRKLVSGPIGIFTSGSEAANQGWTVFVRFLGMLSINLAVINFLPIPPLDGGQMVFLIAEKIRGRPLPESALAPVTWAGILLLLALMALVMFQDIGRLLEPYWPF